jgi:hypothetical protein
MKKRVLIAVVAFVVLVVPAAAAPDLEDGYWWEKLDASFKLGWVSGYAKAMESAGVFHISSCASNMPLYAKEWPGLAPNEILKTM